MRAFALIFGIILLIFGISGFIPSELTDDCLINVFRVNIWLNSLHILSGVVAFMLAWTNRLACLLFFQILGACYAIMALLGFIYGDADILGIFASNRPDTWFHVIIAIAALVLGYGVTD